MEVSDVDVWYNGKYAVSFYEYGTELEPFGRFLGHTWKTWGLVPEARPFFPPSKRKTSELEAKGINGKIDASKSLIGIPLYENREATWKFYVTDFLDRTTYIQDNEDHNILDNDDDPIRASILQTFPEKYSQLLTQLDGREVAIVLGEDPDYFYKGFVDVDTWESPSDGSLNGITLRCDVFPYKIEKEPTLVDLIPNRRFGQEITFDSGNMPVIPYVKVVRTVQTQAQVYATLIIGFSNSEVGLNHPYPENDVPNVHVKLSEGSVEGEGTHYGYRKLVATYHEPTAWDNNAKPSFLCSNYYGNNQCHIITQIAAGQSTSSYNSIHLLFRKGSL